MKKIFKKLPVLIIISAMIGSIVTLSAVFAISTLIQPETGQEYVH